MSHENNLVKPNYNNSTIDKFKKKKKSAIPKNANFRLSQPQSNATY